MPFTVLLLLLVSAVLHAGWNLMLKQSSDKLVFTWLAMAAAAVMASPVLVFMDFQVRPRVLAYLAASAAAESAYFIALSRAYADGDLSMVYPLARGSAPVWIALWSCWLLGERLPGRGWVGLAMVVLGIYMINLHSLSGWTKPLHMLRHRPAHWALLTGFCTSLYSLVDKLGVALMPPPVFLTFSMGLTALMLTPYLFVLRGRAAVWSEVRSHGGTMAVGGLLVTSAYLLVLYAMTRADLSRVGAAREVSIVFGALTGWLLLKERFGLLRTGSAVLIFLGIFLISLR